MSALATIRLKSFNSKVTAKIDFQSGIYVTIADSDIRGLKSLHTYFLSKMVSTDTILEDVSVAETIV